ncbi:MAG: hypothetical protein HOQ28_14845 [Thermoleophilia bacterium]|nr:hypothetical protein [Thermoleophilia bacterium]
MHLHPRGAALLLAALGLVACGSKTQTPEPAVYEYGFFETGPLDRRLPPGVELVIDGKVVAYSYGMKAQVPRELLLSSAGDRFALRTKSTCGDLATPIRCKFGRSEEDQRKDFVRYKTAVHCELEAAQPAAAGSSRVIVDNAGAAAPVTVTIGRAEYVIAAGEHKDFGVSFGDCPDAHVVAIGERRLGELEPQKAALVDATGSHCYRVHTDRYVERGAGAAAPPADVTIDGRETPVRTLTVGLDNVFRENESDVITHGETAAIRSSLRRERCPSAPRK